MEYSSKLFLGRFICEDGIVIWKIFTDNRECRRTKAKGVESNASRVESLQQALVLAAVRGLRLLKSHYDDQRVLIVLIGFDSDRDSDLFFLSEQQSRQVKKAR